MRDNLNMFINKFIHAQYQLSKSSSKISGYSFLSAAAGGTGIIAVSSSNS